MFCVNRLNHLESTGFNVCDLPTNTMYLMRQYAAMEAKQIVMTTICEHTNDMTLV
jgi:hypothetical protein